jgi:hypothetical protein
VADGLDFTVFGVFCGTIAFHVSGLSGIRCPPSSARGQRVCHVRRTIFGRGLIPEFALDHKEYAVKIGVSTLRKAAQDQPLQAVAWQRSGHY